MTGLFRPAYSFLQNSAWQNNAINALRYNTSQQGSVLPLIYGTTRQPVNLINFTNYMGPQGKKGKTGSLPIQGTSNTGKGGMGSKKSGGKKSGQYTVDVDFALCRGPITFNGNNNVFAASGVATWDALVGDNQPMNFYDGADGQPADGTFTGFGFPDNYSGTCHVTVTPLNMGQSPVIPNISFELNGFLFGRDTGKYNLDANPAQVLVDFLTNARYGAGFPIENLDLDTILISHPPNNNSYAEYCQALALVISMSLDGRQKAIEWLDPMIKLTNSEMVWSGNMLKVIPYGDVTVTNNGATFIPNLVPIYGLTDDYFLPWRQRKLGQGPRPGEDDPILLNRVNPADAMNWLDIEYTDRNNFYNTTIVSAYDQGYIDEFGLRTGDTQQGRMFCQAGSAQTSIQLSLQRSLYVRNTPIKFKLGWQFSLLEPMDLVLLTGRSGDLYLNQLPVRILSMEEDENGELTFTAEQVNPGGSIGTPPPYRAPACQFNTGPDQWETLGFYEALDDDLAAFTQGVAFSLSYGAIGKTLYGNSSGHVYFEIQLNPGFDVALPYFMAGVGSGWNPGNTADLGAAVGDDLTQGNSVGFGIPFLSSSPQIWYNGAPVTSLDIGAPSWIGVAVDFNNQIVWWTCDTLTVVPGTYADQTWVGATVGPNDPSTCTGGFNFSTFSPPFNICGSSFSWGHTDGPHMLLVTDPALFQNPYVDALGIAA